MNTYMAESNITCATSQVNKGIVGRRITMDERLLFLYSCRFAIDYEV
jgi:hypothetical protein